MKQKSLWIAIVSFAVALAFVMPGSAAFGNIGTIGVTSDSENTSYVKNTINNVLEKSDDGILSTRGNTIYVDDDADPSWYNGTQVKTIQEGINNATAGGTVYVYNGTYYEHVTVNKQLSLVGESREGVIVNGNGTGNILYVLPFASNTNIDTFTITNGAYGIYLMCPSGTDITNCDVYNNTGTGIGILLMAAPNTQITSCNVYNNTGSGIFIQSSTNIKLRDNAIYDNVGDFSIAGGIVAQFIHDIDP